MLQLPRACLLLASLFLLPGCERTPDRDAADAVLTQAVASPEEGGAVSRAPMPALALPPLRPVIPVAPPAQVPDWSPVGPFGQTAYALWLPQSHLPPKIRVFVDFLAERLRDTPAGDMK